MDEPFTPIAQYVKTIFTSKIGGERSVSHDVYSRGEGPPVVIIQELPGIGIETLRLADHLVAAGFQVVLPHLFGQLEKTQMVGNLLRVFCMRREFYLFRANQSSPIVDWLRALCRHVKETKRAKGVGVIGMCLTGNFAISLMADESVLAAVASQPSLPLLRQTQLHMSPQDVRDAKERIDNVGPIMALRFAGDKLCTANKFRCINDAFNDADTTRIKLTTVSGDGHSVLTRDFINQAGHPTREALDDVVAYFSRQLG